MLTDMSACAIVPMFEANRKKHNEEEKMKRKFIWSPKRAESLIRYKAIGHLSYYKCAKRMKCRASQARAKVADLFDVEPRKKHRR